MSRMSRPTMIPILALALCAARGARAAEEGARVREAIQQLSDNRIEVRQKASTALLEIGEPARPALNEALRSPDPEVQARAGAVLDRLPFKGAVVNGKNSPLAGASCRIIAIEERGDRKSTRLNSSH